MPVTVPNQRTVCVHRERPSVDFLGIKNDNWKAAARDLSAHALKLYMYFAANADNYTFALSPAAITADIGMARSTYHDQFNILVNKGYLVNTHGNTYDFYEKPQPRHVIQDLKERTPHELNFEDNTIDGFSIDQPVSNNTGEDIEINNTQKNNNINNNDNNKKEVFIF